MVFTLLDGTIFTQEYEGTCTVYSSECEEGGTITCVYNASAGKISYERNGVSLGVAFTNVEGEDISPCVVFWGTSEVTLTAVSLTS
jgi:SPRY domain